MGRGVRKPMEPRMTDAESILAAIQNFRNAYNSSDLSALLACYADDLIKVRHGAEPETKADTARRIGEVFEKFVTHVEVDNTEVVVEGAMAFTRGSFRVTLTPREGGQSHVVARRYLEIWQKHDGTWKVARTMDNVI
jgi:ketosteroid isomerase-like protein